MTRAQPILFSGPMVRALLDGRKTQTRRIVKPQPSSRYGAMPSDAKAIKPYPEHPDLWCIQSFKQGVEQYCAKVPFAAADSMEYWRERCRYGKPGDLLWVREASYVWNAGNKDGTGRHIEYRADENGAPCSFTPSIYMPRWTSRLTLEITDIRVERLRGISEKDAKAEGFSSEDDFHDYWFEINPVSDFCVQGDAEDDPWVWVVGFKAHRCNVDDFLRLGLGDDAGRLNTTGNFI